VAYIDVAELQRVLAKPAPTAAEEAAMQRCVDEAAREIDWWLGYTATNPAPPVDDPDYPVLTETNLRRAAELWSLESRVGGVVPVGPESIPIIVRLNTWERHALTLQPLVKEFGFA
jgi:hypothetical protein